MFTGIIEETGIIKQIVPLGSGRRLTITANRIFDDLKIEDSVCISGVCLTIVAIDKASFTVEAVGATLEKTTLGDYRKGRSVNLERALRIGDRLGGHLVQGHVNGIGKITKIQKQIENWMMEIALPGELYKYVISEGSIAVDGVSLTVADLSGGLIRLSLIPYTINHTTFSHSVAGDRCNVETDIIGKYVEHLIPMNTNRKAGNKITMDLLNKAGF